VSSQLEHSVPRCHAVEPHLEASRVAWMDNYVLLSLDTTCSPSRSIFPPDVIDHPLPNPLAIVLSQRPRTSRAYVGLMPSGVSPPSRCFSPRDDLRTSWAAAPIGVAEHETVRSRRLRGLEVLRAYSPFLSS